MSVRKEEALIQSEQRLKIIYYYFIAPEVLAEEPAYPQTDIWSVGVIAYLMLSATSPFRGSDDNETKANITFARYRFENLYKEVTPEATRWLMYVFKRAPL